ncbi:hypothetical protein HY413_01725 [Candidatus Kaiserbacteria bacterium]|nr:hypothetical protein [Candidatus Kaiserbacteria bacterium]
MVNQSTELKQLNTKLDRVLGTMATKDDLRDIESRMATKEDLQVLDEKVDRVIDAMVTRDEFEEFRLEVRSDIAELRESIQRLTTSIDKLAKAFSDLQSEYAAIKMQMSRYDRWFKEIAEKVGIELRP